MDTRTAMLAAEYRRQRDSLLATFPELAEDEQTLADTLEGETELPDIIAKLIRDAREDKAMADALGVMIGEMGERRTRLGDRASKRKSFAMALMQAVGLRKIEQADFTASIRNGTAKVIVTDEDCVPAAYCKVVRSPDKTAIKEALQRGTAIPGALMSNGEPSLSTRYK